MFRTWAGDMVRSAAARAGGGEILHGTLQSLDSDTGRRGGSICWLAG